MKINKFNYTYLRNETHVEFHATISLLIEKVTAIALNIVAEYAAYKAAYDRETGLLDLIRTSRYTREIKEQDRKRNGIYRGFLLAVRSAMEHFDPAKRQAAKHIYFVLRAYGNICRKPLDAKTAAIDDLLRELNGHPAVGILGIGEWLTELQAVNQHFRNLMEARYHETSRRPTEQMRATRKEVDKLYMQMIRRLEALLIVQGDSVSAGFVNELNVVVGRYKNIIAQQAGARQAK
ncbi:MAG: DUF6261 family protein [Tannerellaceae bacterium]|jgi:hypothetical protein|nr:DUF6261 family protein [Tannerellaceae bacterium]